MTKIQPVLLAGGSGTRLWPLSRRTYPKQFSTIFGGETLLQNSVLLLTSSTIIDFAPHITVTNNDFRFIATEQFKDIGIDPGPILIEECAKNTAAPILAASLYTYAKDHNAVLLVAPSDHAIPNKHEFHEAVNAGLMHAKKDKIVTFGITSTDAVTGYGYLKVSRNMLGF